jgi:hypothetical protein
MILQKHIRKFIIEVGVDDAVFSGKEMVFNILGFMHPLLFSITEVELSGLISMVV